MAGEWGTDHGGGGALTTTEGRARAMVGGWGTYQGRGAQSTVGGGSLKGKGIVHRTLSDC